MKYPCFDSMVIDHNTSIHPIYTHNIPYISLIYSTLNPKPLDSRHRAIQVSTSPTQRVRGSSWTAAYMEIKNRQYIGDKLGLYNEGYILHRDYARAK